MKKDHLLIRQKGLSPYAETFQEMKSIALNRAPEALDECWVLQHPPVFTQGLAGKSEHVLAPGDIPIVQTDRGGQVTYHGPGQLIVYPLIHIDRRGLGIRDFVCLLEQAVIELLKEDYGIEAHRKAGAPGVYVDNAKICSLGLKVRKGFSYHGLALNVDMDMEPFSRINPCGYSGLKMVQMKDLIMNNIISLETVSEKLIGRLIKQLGYADAKYDN